MTYNYEYFNRISITKSTQLPTGRMTKSTPRLMINQSRADLVVSTIKKIDNLTVRFSHLVTHKIPEMLFIAASFSLLFYAP